MGRVCRLFQLVQRAVGGGDQRLVAAVSGINHMEYLFQSIVGATLHAEVVNDKQRIAAKAGNILIPACKAGREVAQDNGEVRHIYGDFFLHEGVCDTARKVAFPVADVPPERELKCSQFPSCVDFTGFNCIQNCVYCYYLSFFSKIALKHRPHYFHI